MGTINTTEVAKKNPSIYIEMAQQKAELDLMALENSRQLSLLYLETYANENNLTEDEKIHLESVINQRVFTEEAAVKKGLWQRIKDAFKKLFDWLFGKGSPQIKEEDLNKEVKCNFDANGVKESAGKVKSLLNKLTGSQTKDEAEANSKELRATISKAAELGTKAAWGYVTLSAINDVSKFLKDIRNSIDTAIDSYRASYDREIEKYKDRELSEEEKKKKEDLDERDRIISGAYNNLSEELTKISAEVKRLTDLSAEGKLSEAESEKKDGDESKPDPDAEALKAAIKADGGSISAAGHSGDAFIDWVNSYQYRYSQKELDEGVELKSIGGDAGDYRGAKEAIAKIRNSSKPKMTSSDINTIFSAANVSASKYKIGALPTDRIDNTQMRDDLIKAVGNVVGHPVAKNVIIPALYKGGTDWYHANTDAWNRLGNSNVNKIIGGYVKEDTDSKKAAYTKKEIEPEPKKNGGFTYKNNMNEEETKYVKSIIAAMKSPTNANYNGWTSNDVGKNIKNAIKTTLHIANGADPIYYRP